MSFRVESKNMFGKTYYVPVSTQTGQKLAKATPVGPATAYLRGVVASRKAA